MDKRGRKEKKGRYWQGKDGWKIKEGPKEERLTPTFKRLPLSPVVKQSLIKSTTTKKFCATLIGTFCVFV